MGVGRWGSVTAIAQWRAIRSSLGCWWRMGDAALSKTVPMMPGVRPQGYATRPLKSMQLGFMREGQFVEGELSPTDSSRRRARTDVSKRRKGAFTISQQSTGLPGRLNLEDAGLETGTPGYQQDFPCQPPPHFPVSPPLFKPPYSPTKIRRGSMRQIFKIARPDFKAGNTEYQ